jgi:hypothetical protein
MSSPLSTDFGLPVSSLGSGARVRVPNDDSLYLTSWREATQGRLGQEEGFLQPWRGIVTSYLLLFKCLPAVPSPEA